MPRYRERSASAISTGSRARSGPRRLRCAVYTRKSSEEGLEQSFNSLDAQRDACEAYIASQKHEGWSVVPDKYDDGGFSGGSMERPALRRLLEEVSKGAVDVVVVYKVDRLTRSLADFAKLTDLFERHGTSFVSVTQQFNTSTSMGRLTLNVLLSFAQFERELAGERIRDKIALSKRRGMWMGGLPPLGYDGIDRKLVVNETEAGTVRHIFRRYLELGSVAHLKRALDAEDIVSKCRTFADGRSVGGKPLSRGAVYQILRNRLYRGEIDYRGEIHKGNHDPIIDAEFWDAVQERLSQQSHRERGVAAKPSPDGSLLTGLIFDDAGNRLTPTYASKRGRRYHYYVSAPLTRGGKTKDGIRVPAPDLERLVMNAIADRLRDASWVIEALCKNADARESHRLVQAAIALAGDVAAATDDTKAGAVGAARQMIRCVVVSKKDVSITVDRDRMAGGLGIDGQSPPTEEADETHPLVIIVSAQTLRSGKQVRLVVGDVHTTPRGVDPVLFKLVSDAYRWFDDLRTGRATTIIEIAKREGVQVSHVSRTVSLAFLAPDLVETIVSGRQPPSLSAKRLIDRRKSLPMEWTRQESFTL